MIEADIFNALKGLAANRVFPDVAPAGSVLPYCVYQQVGGVAINFLEATVVGKRNGRFQVSCWSASRSTTSTLARAIEDAMVTTLKATVIGAPISVYEEETQLFGSMQDFSLWFTN